LVIQSTQNNAYAVSTYKNDMSEVAQMTLTGSTFGGISTMGASTLGIYSNSVGGVAIVSENPTPLIKFSIGTGNVNSASEKMRINGAGNLLIGTTADNGSKLQVAGTASANVFTTGNTQIDNSLDR